MRPFPGPFRAHRQQFPVMKSGRVPRGRRQSSSPRRRRRRCCCCSRKLRHQYLFAASCLSTSALVPVRVCLPAVGATGSRMRKSAPSSTGNGTFRTAGLLLDTLASYRASDFCEPNGFGWFCILFPAFTSFLKSEDSRDPFLLLPPALAFLDSDLQKP